VARDATRETIAVLGPGAVGGALAVPLALAGVRVTCVARPGTAEAIDQDGLTLRRRGETFRARPRAVEVLHDRVDLLLVTVKAPALDAALGRIEAEAGTVLPLLNGLEHLDTIRARLGGRVIAGSIAGLEAYRETPTTIVQTTGTPLVTAAGDVSLPGFEVRVLADERALLWEKVARLAPLAAATAATQRPVGDLRADAEWRGRLAAAVDEACEVGRADGVSLDASAQWEIIDGMPPGLTTSTARDVAAGRPSELDAIVGSVVRAGTRLGVPTPALAALLEAACAA
jgi:2-dehydropantoate 2-reductase